MEKCVKCGKMSQTKRKWATFGKMGHSWRDHSNDRKWAKLEKRVRLVKCVKFKNMDQAWKMGSQLKKCPTLVKIGRT